MYLAFLYVPLSNKKMTRDGLRSGCLVLNNTANTTERKLRFDEVEWSQSLPEIHFGIRNQLKYEASFSMYMTQNFTVFSGSELCYNVHYQERN